jgi:hypothetical protein
MLKDLQEQLKKEVARMQDELVTIIKGILNEENVLAKVADDLSNILVSVVKNSEQDGKVVQNEFNFSLVVNEDGKINKFFSTVANVLLVQNGKVVGSYVQPATAELELLEIVFKNLVDFRNKEIENKSEESVEAAPTE